MDFILTNPTRQELVDAIDKAVAAANRGARSRTVRTPSDETIDHLLSCKEDTREDDGGAVPNGYRYRTETSYLGIGRWTAGNGRATVCVRSSRTAARKTPYGRGPGTGRHRGSAWSFVFPDRADKLARLRAERLAKAEERLARHGAMTPVGNEGGLYAVEVAEIDAKGAVAVYRATWATVTDRVVFHRGLIARDRDGTIYHREGEDAAKTVAGLRRKAKARALTPEQREAMADARRRNDLLRQFRVASHVDDIAAVADVPVIREDSLDAGNCAPGTDHFVGRYFPDRESATIGEIVERLPEFPRDTDTLRGIGAACLHAIRRDRNARRVLA